MKVLRNSLFVLFAVKDYFLLGFTLVFLSGPLAFSLLPRVWSSIYFSVWGLLWPLMIADKVFSIALGPIFGEKTS